MADASVLQPRRAHRPGLWAVACSVAFLLQAACGPPTDRAAPSRGTPESAWTSRAELRIVAVTHGVAADPFWAVVANGMADAAEEMGVDVDYQAITTFDMVAMSHLIDAAVASRPDGLVVSVPDVDALGPAIRAAVDGGVPVMSINSGGHAFRDLGLLAHVGQPEYDGGYQGGRRLAAAGARDALCVNHEVGNVALDLRCSGLSDALAESGGSVSTLAVDLGDPEDARQRVRGALSADASLDAVLTLGTAGAEPALQALRDAGRPDVRFGTFDLSPSVLEQTRSGAVLFAIDQQPYLQGYLPVVLLTKYLETGTMPGGGEPIRTGPRFVTAESAQRVLELVERGIR